MRFPYIDLVGLCVVDLRGNLYSWRALDSLLLWSPIYRPYTAASSLQTRFSGPGQFLLEKKGAEQVIEDSFQSEHLAFDDYPLVGVHSHSDMRWPCLIITQW